MHEKELPQMFIYCKVDFTLNDSVKRRVDKLAKDYNKFQQQFDRGVATSSAANINRLLKLHRMYPCHVSFYIFVC